MDRRLVQFRQVDTQPLLFHSGAILGDGKIVGPITSGNSGRHLGGAIGLGYVPCEGESEADVLASELAVEPSQRSFRTSGRSWSGACADFYGMARPFRRLRAMVPVLLRRRS